MIDYWKIIIFLLFERLVKFTYNKMSQFKVSSSVSWGKQNQPCNHHEQYIDYFFHPRKFPHVLFQLVASHTPKSTAIFAYTWTSWNLYHAVWTILFPYLLIQHNVFEFFSLNCCLYQWFILCNCWGGFYYIKYYNYFLHFPIAGYLIVLHLLVIMTKISINIFILVFLWMYVSLRSQIGGSKGRYVFNKLPITFQNGGSILHSHKQYMQIMMAPYPPYVGIARLLNFNDYSGYKTVSHYAFN